MQAIAGREEVARACCGARRQRYEEEGDCAAPHVVMPLAEFSDVTKTYSVSLDKETIEILTQVVNQRGLRVISHFSCTFPVLNSCSFLPPGSCYSLANC